ncbi:putative GroES-like protein [Seiridium cardinale]|uniref:GroES-like protein n=1 Tax=Seiridium cardinale TaxID=138064 RepID=A0ABR2Y7Z4_9PEZI
MAVSDQRTQQAVKIHSPGHVGCDGGIPIPTVRPDEVLVEIKAVALNPFDAKSADLSPTVGATAGCDFSGVVIAVGEDTRRDIALGDRVCGLVFGNNPSRTDNGAFAQFAAVPADLVMMMPAEMGFEEAATLGVGIATVGLALYADAQLPFPSTEKAQVLRDENRRHALVYGGSTATGALAIQLLRHAGYEVSTTCSPKSAHVAERAGAAAIFDYNSPICADEIKERMPLKISLAVDCITSTASMRTCYEVIDPQGGRYISLDPFSLRGHTRRNVKPSWVLALTIFGEAISWSRPYARPARPRDREFAKRWMKVAEGLLQSKAIFTHPVEMVDGGMENIAEALDRIRRGQVSGKKLVCRVA